jgi:hypothetical protein
MVFRSWPANLEQMAWTSCQEMVEGFQHVAPGIKCTNNALIKIGAGGGNKSVPALNPGIEPGRMVIESYEKDIKFEWFKIQR